MANLLVDGFAAYGVGDATAAVEQAMLSGAYAEIGPKVDTILKGSINVQQGLAWDATETSFWITARNTTGAANSGVIMACRRVLPAAKTTVIISLRVALSQLPIYDADGIVFDIRDGSNNIMGQLEIDTTGVLKWLPATAQAALTSAGPVIVAEKAHHIEAKLNMSTHDVTVKVDETTVINGTATYSAPLDVAQIALAGCNLRDGIEHDFVHVTDFILRDTTGTFNNDFVGDRRVATLYPNADDVTFHGWTARPLQRFGVGILDTTAANRGVYAAGTIGSIGASDFTLEGNFRFKTPPANADKAVLFGKWVEDTNQRSYQLYMGGPSLESGYLVFRTSTDGQNGTVAEKLKWPWNPDPERWYHIAVSRDAGVLRLFIDGVQAGIDVADPDTYFASATARPAIGVQLTSAPAAVAATTFVGWQDEFRLTVGVGRYTANFTAPAAAFPRTIGGDPSFASVVWLSGWDNNAIADDGPGGITLTAIGGATWLTPNDGTAAYQTINDHTPSEDNFIEAALLSATGILTLTAVAANTETVTVATKAGPAAAVYTFKTALASAFDVLRGATIADSINNLIAAINHDAGEGTLYGTGTTANLDVQASLLPTGQMLVTALVPGTAGNALASTETLAAGSWTGATLAGGQNIPGPSYFSFERLPPQATIVDSVTFVGRQYKTGAGAAKVKQTMIGSGGGTLAGTEVTLGTIPNLSYDTFEQDPDNLGSALTPTVVRTMRAKIDRTA